MASIFPTLAVTIGEPAGIGPDLCLRMATRAWPGRLALIGDMDFLRRRAHRLGLKVRLIEEGSGSNSPADMNTLEVFHVPFAAPVIPGHPDIANARGVLALLDHAIDGCKTGRYSGMVTAPVHKAVINDAGIAFTGHTEYLADKLGAKRVVMLLVGGGLRVALATTHIPLASVPAAMTISMLLETLRIIANDLTAKFGIGTPRIAVCGLNPHAGEGGYLGREEIDVIGPAIAAARSQGIRAAGPFPADTLFVPEQRKDFDCVLAMFHDQGLPTLKQASFGRGVNVTLGLPIVRTSVDHGTALDLATTPEASHGADPGSLFAAVELAFELASTRHE